MRWSTVMTLLLLFVIGHAAEVATPPVVPEEVGQSDEAAVIEAEPAPELSGRDLYNTGVASLAAGDANAAADSFLAARDAAGPDGELRYRAAYNLGLALAQAADAMTEPADAMAKLRESAAWFGDGVRLAPLGDDDARINLEIVMRRILELADQLNQGRGLEAKLDRVIDDQRGARDQIRRLMIEVEGAGAASEPVAFERQFDQIAERERMLLAEASTVAELAADERQGIESKGEEATQEERVRALQLANLDDYVQRARQSLSDARRHLRRLAGERAHRRAEAGLEELKRAREQLADPVTVLKAVLRDQNLLVGHTGILAESTVLRPQDSDAPSTAAPPWITVDYLEARQENAAVRTGETLMRFKAGMGDDAGVARDPTTQRLRRAVNEAVPILDDGLAAMRNAMAHIGDENWMQALTEELTAIEALNRAIERFAGLRDLVELAYADQTRLAEWLVGDDDGAIRPTGDDLIDSVSVVVADNLDRMARLEELLQEELLPQAPADNASGDDAANQEAARQRFELAEGLRGKTIAELDATLGAIASGPDAALAPAAAARDTLEELRRLFFTLVEHLAELHAAQTETHDETASTFSMEPDGAALTLGSVTERQAQHATLAEALSAALAEQADAASTEQSQGIDLAAVVDEVRGAHGRMQSAHAGVLDAAERAVSQSPVLEPVLDDQAAAMDHLETAIRLLQPPQDNQENQQGEGQQQQQQHAAEQQQQNEQQMSERQALRRLQAIRDRDAARQRDRDTEAGQRDPVEKDW